MTAAGQHHLVVDTFGPVLRVTLNRPERRNALSERMLADLRQVITTAGQDQDTSVLVLRGAGPDFCSGYDLTTTPAAGRPGHPAPLEHRHQVERDTATFQLLRRCPIPTIAQLHGHCLAAGTDLALSCDLLICATDARIGYPAVRSMGTPATHMWLYHLGAQWTKRLLLTGDSITGTKAAELGLALEAVTSHNLDGHVLDLATRISHVPRDLLVANKHVVDYGLDLMGRALLQDTAITMEVLAQQTPAASAFRDTVAARGMRQAVAERDASFAATDPIG